MANRVIEAQLKLTGSDAGMGATIDKVAKKIEQLNAAGKSATAIDRMALSIERAKNAMAAVDRFNMARGGFADARTRFREAQIAVERTARAMAAAEAPTRALETAHRRAAAAVSAAARAFEQQKNEALSSKRALEGYGIPLKMAASEQDRLRQSIERTTAAMARQERNNVGRQKIREAVSGAEMFAGPVVLHAVKEAATSGAEIQSEIVKMRAAGIPEDDIQRAVDQTAGMMPKYTNVKRSESLERFKELRSVLQNPEEAHELLDTTVRANSAMNAIDRSGHLSEGLGFAIKGSEVLGRAQDPERFKNYIDAAIKGQQVMGKSITPEMQYEISKYYRASGSQLSDRFVNTTGLSLGQEMGSSAGVGTDQFIKQIIGGFQGAQHSAAKSFVSLGLARQEDFETTKTGEIKGFKPGRHVEGWKQAQSDPDKWVYEHYLPALAKAGITSPDDIQAHVRRDFPNGRAADLVSKLITQRPSFDNHAKLYGEAQGIDAVDNNKKDMFVALNSLNTSLHNFAGTLTSPAMEGASTRLSDLATSIGGWGERLAKWQKDNPDYAGPVGATAMIGGGALGAKWTYGLLQNLRGGFGLTASAAALDESAVALNAAAARLAVGGAVSTAAPAVAETAVAGAAAASPWLGRIAAAVPFVGPAVIIGGVLYKMTQEEGYDGLNINSERNRKARGGSIRDANIRAFNEDRDRLGISRIGQEDGRSGEVREVTGTLEVRQKFEAGDGLIKIIEDQNSKIAKISGKSRWPSDGLGSTGKSSSDAMPHGRRGD